MDKIKLMTDEEKEKLRNETKKSWLGISNAGIERALRLDSKMRQQIECRISALEEILNERNPDNKSKQYID